MRALEERLTKDAKILPGNIIKVDGFLNHQIDVDFLALLAEEFFRIFANMGITKILTVEASGIALATLTAQAFKVPLVFAKKAKSDNIEGGLYKSSIYSYTYKQQVTLIVSQQWLTKGERVLIVDDFLANGEALRGLIEICTQAGADVVGIGIAVEKGFQQGGDKLRQGGANLHSLAIIDDISDGTFVFRQ